MGVLSDLFPHQANPLTDTLGFAQTYEISLVVNLDDREIELSVAVRRAGRWQQFRDVLHAFPRVPEGEEILKIAVDARNNRTHAKDCADCETRSGFVQEFQREISLDGDLSEAQRQRMLEIADRYLVHRKLEGEIKVRSRLGQPEDGSSAKR